MKKINFILKITTFLFLVIMVVPSCKKNFLEVTDPNVLSPDNFPNNIGDLNIELNDLYGRLRGGFYETATGLYPRFGISMDHSADQNYGDPNFNAACQISFASTNTDVDQLWNSHFENIGKCLAFITDVTKYRTNNPSISDDDKATLNYMEGQTKFIRAWNYMILVNFFGETMITSATDGSKMGVPIIETLASSLDAAQTPRKTIREVWDYIIADLISANALLEGKTWSGSDIARVSTWAVKGMLGKAYVYTQDWANAKATLQTLINTSGKTLVSFSIYQDMFNGRSEFNNESLFELNNTGDKMNEWNTAGNNGSRLNIFIAPSYANPDGSITANGFGNYYVHDKNLKRYGWNGAATDPVDQRDPAYIAQSRTLRNTKQVDPRLWVSAFQPYLDSLVIDGSPVPAAKNTGATFPTTNQQAWSFHKFVQKDKSVWSGETDAIHNGNNMYILRMADIYLLYAEAVMNLGDNTTALEYINKVHRRAYDQPVDVPGSFDYTSLTSDTKAADPALKMDPLKYERWAELFAEGTWWFDICRWRLGQSEATYYVSVGSGSLSWDDKKYALPIPIREINTNKLMVQNPGY